MRVRFNDFVLDTDRRELLRNDQPLQVAGKALQLLQILIENRPKAVAQQELYDQIWPGTFVEEGNLTQHVFTLRKALGTQTNGEHYVQTASRRGYCFEADVRESTDTAAPP